MTALPAHLTIGELARRTGVATSALRFYEAEGLVQSERLPNGHRRYARNMVRRVSFVLAAQRVGLTLAEIRTALATLPANRTPTPSDWARLSQTWRPVLDARIEALVRLRDRLDGCIGCGCLSLRTCALHNPQDAAAKLGSGPRYLLGDDPHDVASAG